MKKHKQTKNRPLNDMGDRLRHRLALYRRPVITLEDQLWYQIRDQLRNQLWGNLWEYRGMDYEEV